MINSSIGEFCLQVDFNKLKLLYLHLCFFKHRYDLYIMSGLFHKNNFNQIRIYILNYQLLFFKFQDLALELIYESSFLII